MNAQDIRNSYLKFMKDKNHALIQRASLVPQNDPTTLFTGSGMQPLLPYLLGEEHQDGVRLADSQPVLRAEDIDEVGDNRHTTFFEMLGNWSLGDYFKEEQIPWAYELYTEVFKIDPSKLYITCFIGDPENGIPKDTEAARLWRQAFLKHDIDAEIVDMGSSSDAARKGMRGGRIFYYDAKENWWSRAGVPENMPVGEPGGPDSEMFYEFEEVEHDTKYGDHCHPACDCGRYIEVGNSVFMEYIKNEDGFGKLPKQNVDFGGGVERIAQAAIGSPDMFKISLIWPIIEKLEQVSDKKYDDHRVSMQVIADHLRGATFLGADGVIPSNTQQGYVMRRLLRRAIRFSQELGFDFNVCQEVVPVITEMYAPDYPEVAKQKKHLIELMVKEEKLFRQTLKKGLSKFEKKIKYQTVAIWEGEKDIKKELKEREADVPITKVSGDLIFELYDTYGFPKELTLEEAKKRDIPVEENWESIYNAAIQAQRERSRTASKGEFKGGLQGTNPMHVKYHTTTHVMYRALRKVLGDHVEQRGSNITEERTRFDFNHPDKLTPEQIKEVEDIVNKVIDDDIPVTWEEMPTKEALASGARGHFGEKYGETSKVYIIGPKESPYSMELCGGPHVEHTGMLGDGGKRFKIVKEQSSSAGIRRIKAVLQ